MRIISGKYKGKKIDFLKNSITRPLKDSVRENIFNILQHSNKFNLQIEKSKILDLYSGVGSFGLECLSRGAKEVVFFENYHKSIKVLVSNINKLNLQKKTIVIKENAYELKKFDFEKKKFDLVFLDPPFNDKNIFKLIEEIKKSKIYNNKTIFILHRNKKLKENTPDFLEILSEKNYGLSKIIFFEIN